MILPERSKKVNKTDRSRKGAARVAGNSADTSFREGEKHENHIGVEKEARHNAISRDVVRLRSNDSPGIVLR